MPREVRVLAVIAFVVALGFGIVAPAIPLFARDYGVGTTAIGLAVSAFAFLRFVSAFGGGALVERVGERLVLTAGLLVVAVTTGLAALAGTFPLFVALRAAGGAGSAMFTIAALSLLLRVAPPDRRGQAAAVYQGGFILGGIAGPAFGGLLTAVSPRLPFGVYAATLVVAAAVAVVMLRSPEAIRAEAERVEASAEVAATDAGAPDVPGAGPGAEAPPVAAAPRVAGGPPAPARGPLRAALGSRAYLAALVVNLGVGWMLFGVRNSLVPLYVVEDLGRTAAWAGAGLLAGSLAQALGLLRAGRLADSWGRRPSLLVGTGIGVAAVALLAAPASTLVFLVAMSAYGLAASLLASVPASVVGDVAPARSGRVVAVFQMSSDLGAILGPLAAGALTDAYSFQVAFAVSAGVVALGLVATLAMPRRVAPVA